MAPHKPATRASARARKTPASKQSENRVVKRPARGYHTFRNGMLNVKPKGDEQELVKNNQNSPLLRLPPEIRNRIWELTLGDKTVRHTYPGSGRFARAVFKNAPRDRKNATALLRACRQIYTETALLPYKLNMFSTTYYWAVHGAFKRFRTYQRSQINKFQYELQLYHAESFSMDWLDEAKFVLDLPKWLPNLQRVQICLFSSDNWNSKSLDDCERVIRASLETDMCSRGYELSIKKIETTWNDFDNEWSDMSVVNAG